MIKHELKADHLHPRNYPHTPASYRHTDKHIGLVMTPIALFCTRQNRAPNIDRYAPEIWPLPRPLTLTLKQDNSDVKTRFWHLTLTLDLQHWPTIPAYSRSRSTPMPKNQGPRSNGSARRVQTNKQTTHGQTDGWTLPSAWSPCFVKATQSIIKGGQSKW